MRHRLQICEFSGKISHPHEDLAQLVSLRHRAAGHNMEAYVCHLCGHWHTGHKRYEPPRLSKRETRDALRLLIQHGRGSSRDKGRSRAERRRYKADDGYTPMEED
jgi:hypothetical protein